MWSLKEELLLTTGKPSSVAAHGNTVGIGSATRGADDLKGHERRRVSDACWWRGAFSTQESTETLTVGVSRIGGFVSEALL